MKKYFLILFIGLSFIEWSFSQSAPYLQAIDSARVLVEEFMEKSQIPGSAISVMVDGRIVWSEGFGFADLENQVPVRAGITKFRVGSVSKPITAAALGVLMDQDKIDLDAPIQKYVPSFPEKRGKVTLRLLAGHLAGIRHYRGNEFLSSRFYATVDEGLEIFAADTLLFEPGSHYSYSSYGWNLISAAIETAAKEDFLDYVEQVVFSPLGMTATDADINSEIIPNRARFYSGSGDGSLVNSPYVDNSYKWAGGGFISTTDDLVRFANAHLSPGYLSESTLKTWTTPQQKSNGESTGYGIGWRQQTGANDQVWIGHSGGSVGGITQLIAYPKQKVIVAMLTNSDRVSYGNVHHQIAQLFFE